MLQMGLQRTFRHYKQVLCLVLLTLLLATPVFANVWNFPPSYSKSYTLSTGYSSAGFTLSYLGHRLYALTNYSGGNWRVEQYSMFPTWDISTAVYMKSINVGAMSSPTLTYLDGSGKNMFIAVGGEYALKKYTMSTAFDVATLAWSQTATPCGSNYVLSASFSLAGNHMIAFCGDGSTRAYTLSTAFDLSTLTQTDTASYATPYVVALNLGDDGTTFLGSSYGAGTDYIRQFTCGIAYTPSTCSVTSSFDYSTLEGDSSGFYTYMYASLYSNYIYHMSQADRKKIYQYDVISGSTFESSGFASPSYASASYQCDTLDFACQINKMLTSVLQWLFIPSQTSLNQFGGLWDTIKNKPPIGYFTTTKDALTGLNVASGSYYLTFSGLDSGDSPLKPLKIGLTWVLWLMLGFWILHRVRQLEI